MAKKLEKLKALGRIDYNGGVYLPGDTFDCDAKEATRLKDLGVATPALLEVSSVSSDPLAEKTAQEDLLAKVAAATSREELEALVPEEKPEDAAFAEALKAAAEKRWAELDEPDH